MSHMDQDCPAGNETDRINTRIPPALDAATINFKTPRMTA